MRQWHFFDKVYRRWVVVMVGDLADFRDEMEAIGFDDLESLIEAKGMCIELSPSNNSVGNNAYIIWLNGYETGTLVHEITHLVMMCFDHVGVPISRENTESFAFYTEYWFGEIQRARRKYPDGRTVAQAKAGK